MKLTLHCIGAITHIRPSEMHKIPAFATNRFFRVLSGVEYLRRGMSRCANNLNHHTVLNECRTHPERLQRVEIWYCCTGSSPRFRSATHRIL